MMTVDFLGINSGKVVKMLMADNAIYQKLPDGWHLVGNTHGVYCLPELTNKLKARLAELEFDLSKKNAQIRGEDKTTADLPEGHKRSLETLLAERSSPNELEVTPTQLAYQWSKTNQATFLTDTLGSVIAIQSRFLEPIITPGSGELNNPAMTLHCVSGRTVKAVVNDRVVAVLLPILPLDGSHSWKERINRILNEGV